MPVFVTSFSQVGDQHGVFAIERQPPATIAATGTAMTALVGRFPWGPAQEVTQLTSNAEFINTVAPPGMSRTGTGYLAWSGKAWPFFKWVRVTGTGAAPSVATVNKTGPTAMLTLTLKYNGAAGNSVTWTTSAASDGDANHFNLEITVTSSSGTTTDKIENLNYSGVGSDSDPDLTSALLIGTIAKLASGVPILTTGTFSTGSDGTITAPDYVGTEGTGDVGMALLEAHDDIDGFFVDDCGNSLRDAVNAGGVAHADYMTDRVYYANGDSGQTLSAVQTDVDSYRSKRAVYVDGWGYMRDDVTGALQLVPTAGWAASVAANLSPSTSIAWKSATVRQLMRKLVSLETPRGMGKVTNTTAGICTIIPGINGGFVFEAAIVTNAPNDPATKNLTRTRMAHYIARSEVQSLQEFVDSPNVPFNQQDEINAVTAFLSVLKGNATTDPNNLPHILDFSIPNVSQFNPQTQLDAGIFVLPQNIKLSSAQSQIFMSLQIGETVEVNVEL